MVALLSNVIHSYRCLVSILPESFPLKTLLAIDRPVVHHWNIPLPLVIHKTLAKEFVDQFQEVVVIGDIHGCYDEMQTLLDQIHGVKDSRGNDTNNNNRKNGSILKLFVGDLVNKGPKSDLVVDYLMNNSDNCVSVRGNHDDVVIRWYLKYESDGESVLKDKDKWIKDLRRPQIDYLIAMPYTISIPSLNALVVHAGVVPDVPLDGQTVKDMIEMRNVFTDEDSGGKWCATSSHEKGVPWVNRWSGPQHVYFGHDAKRRLQMRAFATGLDTGCVYGRELTAVFISGQRKGSFLSVKATRVHSEPKIDTPKK